VLKSAASSASGVGYYAPAACCLLPAACCLIMTSADLEHNEKQLANGKKFINWVTPKISLKKFKNSRLEWRAKYSWTTLYKQLNTKTDYMKKRSANAKARSKGPLDYFVIKPAHSSKTQ
jgi:hypothetical protein